jgi:hypothetical protein
MREATAIGGHLLIMLIGRCGERITPAIGRQSTRRAILVDLDEQLLRQRSLAFIPPVSVTGGAVGSTGAVVGVTGGVVGSGVGVTLGFVGSGVAVA